MCVCQQDSTPLCAVPLPSATPSALFSCAARPHRSSIMPAKKAAAPKKAAAKPKAVKKAKAAPKKAKKAAPKKAKKAAKPEKA